MAPTEGWSEPLLEHARSVHTLMERMTVAFMALERAARRVPRCGTAYAEAAPGRRSPTGTVRCDKLQPGTSILTVVVAACGARSYLTVPEPGGDVLVPGLIGSSSSTMIRTGRTSLKSWLHVWRSSAAWCSISRL